MEAPFQQEINLTLPARMAVEGRIAGNPVRQLAETTKDIPVVLQPFTTRYINGFDASAPDGTTFRIVPRTTTADLGEIPVLLIPGADNPQQIRKVLGSEGGRWLQPQPIDCASLSRSEAAARCAALTESWRGKFRFDHPEPLTGQPEPVGLRAPQIGALHAVLAHWSVSTQPATIVMPTGTGKTETMLAVSVRTRTPRLLVVVPNVEVRDQIANKFLTLGVLKQVGSIDARTQLPVVATLVHRPKTPDEVDEIFERANVIVTTMTVAGQCAPEVCGRMAARASHLFIDEAHHVAARTWNDFKAFFHERTVLQFTATPFRTDGKRVDGKFIYVYPLAKAQAEGYFKLIQFRGVHGLDRDEADDAIINHVSRTLAEDLKNGYDHLVMARVDKITRASEVFAKYLEELPQFAPLLIHSDLSKREKREALDALRARRSRIIVCVDMLGEGFDLPELKIAALHDRHKSIAVTLQFTGRFTRTKSKLGDATVIANIAQDDVEDALRALYAEDADWNFLLSVLSESRTERQVKRAEILQGFSEKLADIPLQTLYPKMSTVVFKTTCEDWDPSKIDEAIPPTSIHAGPAINHAARLAVFVTKDDEFVRWGETKQIVNTEWNLYLVHWDESRKLLFINSSKPKEFHDEVAKAVCGESATRVSGETIFRCLDGFNRLVLRTLGLSHTLGRYVRYTMFLGTDITEQLSDAATANKRKSNLFGQGFTQEGKGTIGCSAKGRIWSHRIAWDFSEWIDWCHVVGDKLLDESVTTDRIIANLVKPRRISARPEKPPVAVHWPETFLEQLEDRITFDFDGVEVGFHDCDIELIAHEATGPVLFRVRGQEKSATFEAVINERGADYPLRDGGPVSVRIGSKSKQLSEWFSYDPPQFHFADGDFLVFNELFELPRDRARIPFALAKIEPRDWTGVEIRQEAQGPEKDPATVQGRIIQDLRGSDEAYDVVFDDDGAGEVADVLGIRTVGRKIQIDFFHCKFAHGDDPGSRVKDLYEVCGQAQKSVRWREHPWRLLKHLLRRDADRRLAGQASRVEAGSIATLKALAGRWREFQYEYRMFIVQPGLSKANVTQQQLDLLAATESYLLDTYAIPLRVISAA